ncbi:MAG: MFS transporter [Chloroflexi bacterium]|nr:MFS transporter [Chloroflexota bacterium]
MRTASRDDADGAATAVPARGLSAALHLLRSRNYRIYWSATVPWNLARWTEIVVAGWLMLELTNSPWQVALLGFCRSAALPLIGPFAGVIADRVDRLALIRGAQVLNVAVTAVMTVLVASGVVQPWHLYAGSLLLGLSWALDWPSRRALMVDIIDKDNIVQGTVLDNVSMNVSKIVGPALAGLLLALSGPGLGYGVLLLCFMSSSVLFWLVRRPARTAARVTGSPLRSLGDGLLYVMRERAILAVLLITIVMNFFIFPYMQLLPVVARDELQVGPVELGWLAAADGIGALIGLPLILRLRGGGPQGWWYILGSALMSLTNVLFALCPWYWLALLLLIIGGIGHAGFGTMQGTIILSQAGPEMRGRALGVLTLAIGSSPFGALAMGALAQRWDAAIAIAVCGFLSLLGVIAVAAASPQLRTAGQTRAA